MKIAVKKIAKLINGVIDGDDDISIVKPSNIDTAQEGAITFLANLNYEKYFYDSKASVIIVSHSFIPKKAYTATLIRVKDVYSSFGSILQLFEKRTPPSKGVGKNTSIHPTAHIGTNVQIGDLVFIHQEASIGNNCIIYPQVYIGANVQIGQNCVIYPGVKIYNDCNIGENCIFHANAVIGSDGFGFAPLADGSYAKIPQVGRVVIENNVEIGANTVIDRATIDDTIIKEGTKLDNLIQVGHNVKIGAHTVIAAQTGISGSTQIGDFCQIGGQVGFVGHIQIADKTQIQAQSGIAASIPKEGQKVYGYPAINYRDYLKAYSLFRQFPDIEKRIRVLEKQIGEKS